MIVRRFTNLNEFFNANEYIEKKGPFKIEEVKEILKKYNNEVEEKWIPYVQKWLNKKLLWVILSN